MTNTSHSAADWHYETSESQPNYCDNIQDDTNLSSVLKKGLCFFLPQHNILEAKIWAQIPHVTSTLTYKYCVSALLSYIFHLYVCLSLCS